MRYEYADAIMLENVDTIYLLSFGKKEKKRYNLMEYWQERPSQWT